MKDRIRNTFFSKTYILFIVATIIVCSTPYLNRGVLLGLVSIVSMLFVLASVQTMIFGRHKSVTICVFLYLFIVFSYRIIGYSDAALGRYVVISLSLLLLLSTFLTGKMLYSNRVGGLFLIAVLFPLFNIAWNIFMAIRFPELHEYMGTFDLSYLYSINVGGSDFYTFSLFFYFISLFVFLNVQRGIMKIIMLLCTIISGVFIVGYCFKASVVVLMLVGTLLIFFSRGKSGFNKVSLAIIVATAVLLLVFTLFSSEIIQIIVDYSPSARLAQRLVGLIDAENEYGSISSLEARENLWLLSLNTWLQNPMSFMFGIGDHYAAGGNSSSGISQHSEFLDILACYGVVGGGLIFIILKKSWKYIISLFNNDLRGQVYIILLLYLVCGVAKLVFLPGVSCVIFLLLPLSSQIVNKA